MGEVAFAKIDAEFDRKEGCEFSQVCDGMLFDVGAEYLCVLVLFAFFIFVLSEKIGTSSLCIPCDTLYAHNPSPFLLEPPSTFDMKQTYILPTTRV